jgi:hypothetical protein
MSANEPNSDEGASPAEDVKKQNPTGTTTGDQTGETGGDHKVEDLAKAGRDDMDTNEAADNRLVEFNRRKGAGND